jgi:hypothetical protein
MNRTRRLILGVMAKQLTGKEASRLLSQFLAFDADFNGTLDYEELQKAARQVGGWRGFLLCWKKGMLCKMGRSASWNACCWGKM